MVQLREVASSARRWRLMVTPWGLSERPPAREGGGEARRESKGSVHATLVARALRAACRHARHRHPALASAGPRPGIMDLSPGERSDLHCAGFAPLPLSGAQRSVQRLTVTIDRLPSAVAASSPSMLEVGARAVDGGQHCRRKMAPQRSQHHLADVVGKAFEAPGGDEAFSISSCQHGRRRRCLVFATCTEVEGFSSANSGYGSEVPAAQRSWCCQCRRAPPALQAPQSHTQSLPALQLATSLRVASTRQQRRWLCWQLLMLRASSPPRASRTLPTH